MSYLQTDELADVGGLDVPDGDSLGGRAGPVPDLEAPIENGRDDVGGGPGGAARLVTAHLGLHQLPDTHMNNIKLTFSQSYRNGPIFLHLKGREKLLS